MRMAKAKIEHVKQTKAKGRTYWYFDTGQVDRGGKKIWSRLPDPADKSFWTVYATMIGHRNRRNAPENVLTAAALVDLYMASQHFEKKAESTRKIYSIYLQHFVATIGKAAPAAAIERKDVVLMLDKMAMKPGAANMVLASVRACYSWARKRGHVETDPCRDIDPFELGEHDPWPQATLDAALVAEDATIRLAVHLLYYTAQRIGDVVRMRWTDIDGDRITVRQQKTGKSMQIRMHGDLVAELAKHQRSLATILPGPMIPQQLRSAIQKFCAGRGFDIVPHGLRKNAVNALLEAECSVAETAAISGQSLGMVEFYSKKRSQITLGDAAILKWEKRRK